MFERIEKYIKDRVDRIVFIELKEDVSLGDRRLQPLEKVPIPVNIRELTKPIIEGKGHDISLASMARGMIYLMGVDSKFRYMSNYKEFLYGFDKEIEEYIAYEGLKSVEQENFYDGLIYFKSLIALNEDNINGLFNYARCCQDIALKTEEQEMIKDFNREAMDIFETIVEKHPDFAQAYYYLGFHYANEKLYKKAQLTWESCLELDIDEEKTSEILLKLESIKDQVQYEEGYSFILHNQPALGIEKLVPLLEKYSDWWNLLFFIGLGYRHLGNCTEAIGYFEKILMLKPTQVDTLNELGLCYAAIQDFVKAEKYLKKANGFKENDSEILCNLGMVYMEWGKYDLAREILEKSMALNPEDEITKECIRKLNTL